MQKDKIIISHKKPEIYQVLHDKFGVDWDNGLIIAYDGKIHCKEIPQAQKIIHESIHLNRQKEIGNEVWWRLYIESEQFRLDEEILAYLEEAKFLKKNIKNREHLFRYIRELADNMSSGIYGRIVTREQAIKILK